MGWERRRNGLLFYYRGRRVGGRVVKEYIGRGPAAEAAAAEDAARRKERDDRRQAEAGDLDKFERIGALVDNLSGQADAALRAALSKAGYHEHRGQWRKRRHGRAEK